jgi:hypothetical protein
MVGSGTTLYSRDVDSYFATVERLYAAGARQFVFNNVVPFDRAQDAIGQGSTLQTKLKVCTKYSLPVLELTVKKT